ncbi:MAG: hypothetical protein LBE13_11380, partial [Bacteroidales bacterium]|nr:hypothetical protein [Bacteroidales bacterium]
YSAYLPENGNDNDVRLSAIENDIEWATKVAAARNAYYSALGSAISEYNNAVIDALEAYNETVLGAEIARAKAHFDAAESYSKDSYDLEADYAKAQFETNKKNTLAAIDAAIAQMVGLAELDAYFARKTADEYGAITVDDDYGIVTNQIYYDNYLASSQKRQEINDTKTSTDKTNRRQARRDNNNDYTNYFEALLALQTTYEITIATADETYYNTITTADATFNETVTEADKKYNEDYYRLTGQFYDAMMIIDRGDNIDDEFFENTNFASLNFSSNFSEGEGNSNGNGGNDDNKIHPITPTTLQIFVLPDNFVPITRNLPLAVNAPQLNLPQVTPIFSIDTNFDYEKASLFDIGNHFVMKIGQTYGNKALNVNNIDVHQNIGKISTNKLFSIDFHGGTLEGGANVKLNNFKIGETLSNIEKGNFSEIAQQIKFSAVLKYKIGDISIGTGVTLGENNSFKIGAEFKLNKYINGNAGFEYQEIPATKKIETITGAGFKVTF